MDFSSFAATVGLASLVGSITTGFITHFINKNDRKSLLNKEEYYQLQQKAEIIFGSMHQYEELLTGMLSQLEQRLISLPILDKNKDLVENSKQKVYEVIHVYFWDQSTQFNEYSEGITNIMEVYFKVILDGKFTTEDISQVKTAQAEYSKKQFEFTSAILASIDKKRVLI